MNRLSSVPHALRDGLNTAYVAYEEAFTGSEIELSVRTVQGLLSSASHNTGSGVLMRLPRDGLVGSDSPCEGGDSCYLPSWPEVSD